VTGAMIHTKLKNKLGNGSKVLSKVRPGDGIWLCVQQLTPLITPDHLVSEYSVSTCFGQKWLVYNEHVILQAQRLFITEHELSSQTYTLVQGQLQEKYPNSPVPHKTIISSGLAYINEIITVTSKTLFLLLQVTEFLAYCQFYTSHKNTITFSGWRFKNTAFWDVTLCSLVDGFLQNAATYQSTYI
jgi:hypothetical protein